VAVTAPRPPPSPLRGQQGQGKGGAFLPAPTEGATWAALPSAALRAEVQDLQLAESPSRGGGAVLAAVDCYGRATLAHLQRGGGEGEGGGEGGGRMRVAALEQLQPEDVAVEAGWAGVALAPGNPSQAALARHFAKDVSIFDGPLVVRTLHTLHRPNAVALLSPALAASPGGSGVVAVAEGPAVSVWDLRASGRGARVARLNAGNAAGPLYCLAASDGTGAPLLGAAGADRSVLVWDPRKWATVDRWSNCLKYEATAVHFLAGNPQYCVACGLDYEVVAGRWGGDRRARLGGGHRTGEGGGEGSGDGGGGGGGHLSFRGDSRWLGMGRAQGQDVLAGLTSSAQLYVAELGPQAG
jgi:hypothetical protein